jgi:hypothetical protein
LLGFHSRPGSLFAIRPSLLSLGAGRMKPLGKTDQSISGATISKADLAIAAMFGELKKEKQT